MKRILCIVLAAVFLLSFVSCSSNDEGTSVINSSSKKTNKTKSKKKYGNLDWPTSGIATLLPVPKSNTGKLDWDDSESFSISVADTSKADFKDYIEQCKEKGFTEDYYKTEDCYYATNKEGYYLDLYFEDNNVMTIYLTAPDDEDEDYEDDEFEDEEIYDDYEEEEKETKPKKTSSKTSSKISSKVSSNKVSASFKETMDAYEEFIDEYVEFMNKYYKSDDPISMMSDFNEYMEKYNDYIKKINNMDKEEMTTADYSYLLEVTSRVTKKISEINY